VGFLLFSSVSLCTAQTTQPAGADPKVEGLLKEADQHRRRRAFHLQAQSLENAIRLMKQDDSRRHPAIGRLIGVYRIDMGQTDPAARWIRTLADELRPTPEGIDALFALADLELNHGHPEAAYKIYREINPRIRAPDPPYDRFDKRIWKVWTGEKLCKFASGCDPLFPSDMTVTGRLNRIIQLLRAGSWGEAGVLLDQNLSLRSVIQQKEGPNTWVSARQWFKRAVVQLPADSVSRLEASYRKTMRDLVARRDWLALADFRFHHPLSTLEYQLDVEIGNQLLDLSMPALASLFYGQAIRHVQDKGPPDLYARELFCRVHAGEDVADDEVPEVEVELAGRRYPLRQWVGLWRNPSAASEPSTAPVDIDNAVFSRLPLMRSRLLLRHWQLKWLARSDMKQKRHPFVPEYAENFVTTLPVGSPRCLLANVGDGIQAMDIVDGRTLWTFQAPEENSMTNPNQKWEGKKLFIECARARTAAVQGDRVYCHLAWGHHDTHRQTGGLFALRRSDGAMIWSSLQIPELAGMDIAADPAVYRGVVVAVAWRPRETLPQFYLVGLSAETGQVLWINYLYSGSSLTVRDNSRFLDRPLACGPPTIVDGVAYFCTGAGVVGAVNVIDGTLVWAIEYPRIKAINREVWDNQAAISRPAGIIAVCDDAVLFAPIDSHMLLAVDRTTGELRYSEERLDLRAIAAADNDRVYLQEGTTVRAIFPTDGSEVWKRTLPASRIMGVITLSKRGLMCPTRNELFILGPDNGEILSRHPWQGDQACGNLLDFGDRIVGASGRGLHVFADKPLSEMDDWWLSTDGESEGVEVSVPSRADKWLRWAMPAVNRGDFILSDGDRDRVLIRSELLQMRRTNPIPALLWQRSSPMPWDCEATFNKQRLVIWDRRDLIMLDANTGETLWQTSLPSVGGEDQREVMLVGEEVYCSSAGQVCCLDGRTGQQRWAIQPEGSIHGICFSGSNVGVYVGLKGRRKDVPAHLAMLLDAETGQELARIDIPRPPPPPPPPTIKRKPTKRSKVTEVPIPMAKLPVLIVGHAGSHDDAPATDFVLVDGRLPVHVDWSHRTAVAGDLIAPLHLSGAHEVRLEVYGKYIALRGRDDPSPRCRFPLLAVWDCQKLSRINVPSARTWCIAGDNLYTFSAYRIRGLSLPKAQQQWQSLTLMDNARLIVPTKDHLMVLSDKGKVGTTDLQDVSHVRIFDIHSGDRVKDIRIPKLWVHRLGHQADRLMLWDCTFLYDFETPEDDPPADTQNVSLAGKHADAIGSLKLAADLEDPVQMKIQALAPVPAIDGDLSDWSDVKERRLGAVSDFKPDFAHRNRNKSRVYGGAADLSAIVRVGQADGFFCLAVEVTDDIHVAAPRPGLWRSDSVTFVLAESGQPEIDPTLLTVALVDGVPRFEVGSAVSTVASSNHITHESVTGPGPAHFVLPPLREATTSLILPGATIDLAIRRNEASRRTRYELRFPKPVAIQSADLYWDVLINDNDGSGREGALQLASSVWGIEETAIGSIRGYE